MKLLAIETSCDETAVALIETSDGIRFDILGNALLSQIDIHREYGGVFPALAKRAHARNLVPLLSAALEEAELLHEDHQALSSGEQAQVSELLAREPELNTALQAFLEETERPDIDAIAVTAGPGLEPALWVGINLARALATAWRLPLVPVNHMEGHIFGSLVTRREQSLLLAKPAFPLLALLISGGHTELDVSDELLAYRLVGSTRDDAVGEAFDKVARMMDLPYPGGPEISKLAEEDREDESTNPFRLPRPMIDSDDCDFSFSGLKTAVLYIIKERGTLTPLEKRQLSREFEDAVTEVLWKKTARALDETNANALVIGGGVSANAHIRRTFAQRIAEDMPHISLHLPDPSLTGDNALMIGVAGYARALRREFSDMDALRADGNWSLG